MTYRDSEMNISLPSLKLPKTNASYDEWYDFYKKCSPEDRLAFRMYLLRIVNIMDAVIQDEKERHF